MSLTVYTKNNCPNCDRAKAMLDNRNVGYVTINIEEDAGARDFLLSQGFRSVPQIFNGGTVIPGGAQGLAKQPESFWLSVSPPNIGSL